MYIKNKPNERGFIFLEVIIGLPIIAMLLATIGAVILWSMHQYQCCRADWELQYEVTQAFSSVVADMEIASAVKKYPFYDGAGIWLEQPKVTATGKEQIKTVAYWVHMVKSTKKLVKDDASFPLTGDNATQVYIKKLDWGENEKFPGVYELKLTGFNWDTDHEYSLFTAVYVPQSSP